MKFFNFFSPYFLLSFLLWLSTAEATLDPSEQFTQGLSRTLSQFSAPAGEHTLDFAERIQGNAWLKEFDTAIINGDDTPPELRERGQQMRDQVEELDERCAATTVTAERNACIQQRNAAISQMEKMVADHNPDLAILMSDAAQQAGDFSSEFDPAAMMNQFDSVIGQMGNLTDMLGDVSQLMQTPTKDALETPLPAGSSNDITQRFNVGAENLAHLRQATPDIQGVSADPDEGFFDRIRNWWQERKPGVQTSLIMNAVAQTPFGTLGQSGQSQLRVITSARATETYDRQAKAINETRDRNVTRNNDVIGQGKAAVQERTEQNLEVMDDTTQEQDQALQNMEHICQNQRASIPCWENGNDIPFDLLALLMGALGGGGSGGAPTEAIDLTPYTVWIHCPLPDQPFTRSAEGVSLSGLLLEEQDRLMLTLKSGLPNPMHAEGCIVALPGEEGWEYFSATLQPEIVAQENPVTADLSLLKINTVHTEGGEDLGDPNLVVDDFVNEYWPNHLSQCASDADFQIGDEIQLFGFEVLEEEAQDPAEVVVLNGLANFITDENGVGSFTTNGEESFNGGLVSRKDSGCFKGLAVIEIDREAESNDQTLLPLNLITAWLETQEISLPRALNEEDGVGDR